MNYRLADAADAEAIARLHADSWRRTYRGMFTDEFLDGDLVADRRQVWQERLREPSRDQFVCVADADSELAGFICGYAGEDSEWGSFIDNLHVAREYQGRGIGMTLMRRAAAWFAESYADRGVYLRVMEANTNARRFYESLGATHAETFEQGAHPAGVGRVCRYVWSSPSTLAGPHR